MPPWPPLTFSWRFDLTVSGEVEEAFFIDSEGAAEVDATDDVGSGESDAAMPRVPYHERLRAALSCYEPLLCSVEVHVSRPPASTLVHNHIVA